MNPQSRGTVTLASPDSSDPPVIDPNLLGHSYDKRVLNEGVKEIFEFFQNAMKASYLKQIYRAPKSMTDEDIDVSAMSY
jgi:choline dehydrogenase-like flavoprotein